MKRVKKWRCVVHDKRCPHCCCCHLLVYMSDRCPHCCCHLLVYMADRCPHCCCHLLVYMSDRCPHWCWCTWLTNVHTATPATYWCTCLTDVHTAAPATCWCTWLTNVHTTAPATCWCTWLTNVHTAAPATCWCTCLTNVHTAPATCWYTCPQEVLVYSDKRVTMFFKLRAQKLTAVTWCVLGVYGVWKDPLWQFACFSTCFFWGGVGVLVLLHLSTKCPSKWVCHTLSVFCPSKYNITQAFVQQEHFTI